jgi:hypothetical protein
MTVSLGTWIKCESPGCQAAVINEAVFRQHGWEMRNGVRVCPWCTGKLTDDEGEEQ